jgi:hypothetical protein
VIAARKFLRVKGRFEYLALLKEERETERRKAHLGNGRGLIPGLPKIRGTRQRLSASRRGDFFVPGAGSSERRRELFSPSRQVSPPFTCLVQPLKAEPRSGPGRLPKAPRVRRGTSPPRPQAPHPAPRYKRPGNAPFNRDGIGKKIVHWDNMSSGETLNFCGPAGEDSYARKMHAAFLMRVINHRHCERSEAIQRLA